MKIVRALTIMIASALLAALAHGAAPPPHQYQGPEPYPRYYQREHPQHRLAYWYAGESTRQAEAARRMVCGFTGQRWTLDWEVHYRWALRANPRRVYREVQERDRHLARCRSNKLREHRRPPPGRR